MDKFGAALGTGSEPGKEGSPVELEPGGNTGVLVEGPFEGISKEGAGCPGGGANATGPDGAEADGSDVPIGAPGAFCTTCGIGFFEK